MKRTITVRAAALTAVAALGLSSLGLGAAFAVEDNQEAPAPAPEINASTIDDNQAASLTIHKFTPSTAPTTNGNGTKLDPKKDLPGAKPINNVTFKIMRITKEGDDNFKIKNNASWELISAANDAVKSDTQPNLKAALEAQGLKIAEEATYEGVTGKNPEIDNQSKNFTGTPGVVKIAGIKHGFYYVEEVLPTGTGNNDLTIGEGSEKKAAVQIVDDSGNKLIDAKKINKAQAFMVSVPLTNPKKPENGAEGTERTTWLYDVHVYPKNKEIGNEKSVTDETAYGSGNDDASSNLVYTIKTELPGDLDTYKSYKVVDPLDSRLTYIGKLHDGIQAEDVVADEVTLINANGEKVKTVSLVKDTDYAIDVNGQTVTLKFKGGYTAATQDTAAVNTGGLLKLIKGRDAGAVKLQWKLHARVKDTTVKKDDADTQNDENKESVEIPNTAYQLPPNEANPKWDEATKPGFPTNKVVSKYGKVIIKKVKEDDSTPLNDAKFKLYVCNAEGKFRNEQGEYVEKRSDAAAISVDKKSEWISGKKGANNADKDDDGQIVIDGLRLNNWKNGTPENEGLINPATEYYCLVETQAPEGYELLPNPIKFQLLTNSTVETVKAVQAVKVKNVPDNGGPKLPVTGGQGIALLVTAGGLLVAGSVIYTVAAARKRKQQA